jgi:hypothetical protein
LAEGGEKKRHGDERTEKKGDEGSVVPLVSIVSVIRSPDKAFGASSEEGKGEGRR